MKLKMERFPARMIRQWTEMRVKESPARERESGEAQGKWRALRYDTVASPVQPLLQVEDLLTGGGVVDERSRRWRR